MYKQLNSVIYLIYFLDKSKFKYGWYAFKKEKIITCYTRCTLYSIITSFC